MTKHLWECDHSYYCTESNYYAKEDISQSFSSFKDFLAEWEDADDDYNLIFRWDWHEDEDRKDDDNYRSATLKIFYMIQRKGYHICCTIQVCRNDEDEIKAFLQPKFQHLANLWKPFEVINED